MRRLNKGRTIAGRSPRRPAGYSLGKDPVCEANEALLNAISDHGYNSPHAVAARFVLGEVTRRLAS